MKPAFEFPSEADRREREGKDTKAGSYPTISRLNVTLTPESFRTYLNNIPIEMIDADITNFQIEARKLQDTTQEMLKGDREWEREMRMMVSGTSAMMGVMLSLGILPDGINREDLQGDMPIKKQIFPLLDEDYQLRVDMETQNLIVRKCQLQLLEASKVYKTTAAGSLVDTVKASTTRLLTHVQSAVAAKEALQVKLDAVQQDRVRVVAEIKAYHEAHPFNESDVDDAKVSSNFHKVLGDLKAGKPLPRPSREDTIELLNGMFMQTTDEMIRKVPWGKDPDGRSIAQIAREEGKTFGEVLDEVSKAKKDFEKQKKEGKEGKEGEDGPK